MKIQITGLIITLFICSAFSKPGGMYTLTGEEKGIDAIVKADMQQFPEYYKGETFRRYLAEFKKVNNIGKKKFKPGDQLRFPDTKASKSTDDALPEPLNTVYVSNATQLKKAVGEARPGDHIVLKKDATWADIKITVDRNGTKENPIVVKAEEIGEVKITGTSKFTLSGKYIILQGFYFTEGGASGAVELSKSSSYCRMTRCIIYDLNPEGVNGHDWVFLRGTHNRVDHCHFSEQRTGGQTICMYAPYPNYNRIDHNHFIGQPKRSNGCETIKLGQGGGRGKDLISHTVVEYNLLEKCDADGGENISIKCDDNIIRYNTFKNHNNAHVTLRGCNRIHIEGNYFLDNGLGIRVYGEDNVIVNNYFKGGGTGIYLGIGSFKNMEGEHFRKYNEPVNTLLAHNTFHGVANALKIGVGNGLPPVNTMVVNNLIYGASDKECKALWIDEKCTDITYSGNMIYRTTDKPDAPGIRIQDPMLTENQYGLFQLSRKSPCINGGAAGPAPIDMDIKKDARSDQRRDIGSEEYYAGHNIGALTADDVGPFSY